MKQHRRITRSMAMRKATPGAFASRSQSQFPRRETTLILDWSCFGHPAVIVADNGRDVIGPVSITAPRKA